jgi:hypothetical protein
MKRSDEHPTRHSGSPACTSRSEVDLRAEGVTDHLALPLMFMDRAVHALSGPQNNPAASRTNSWTRWCGYRRMHAAPKRGEGRAQNSLFASKTHFCPHFSVRHCFLEEVPQMPGSPSLFSHLSAGLGTPRRVLAPPLPWLAARKSPDGCKREYSNGRSGDRRPDRDLQCRPGRR